MPPATRYTCYPNRELFPCGHITLPKAEYLIECKKAAFHLVLPRELPSAKPLLPEMSWIQSNTLEYMENLVDALGLEPRTR